MLVSDDEVTRMSMRVATRLATEGIPFAEQDIVATRLIVQAVLEEIAEECDAHSGN